MKILLVRLRLIGDVVFTTPLVRTLRARYPEARISYLVEAAAAPVLQGNPHLDELIVVPRSTGIARVRDDLGFMRRLRRARFDLAIDLHGGPRAAWLTWASGARRRVGYALRGRSWMYTDPVERAADLGPRHSVRNQWDLLAPLGLHHCDPERDPVEMSEDRGAAARVEQRLRDAGVVPGHHRLVVVHVSAGNRFRRWPSESFRTLVTTLVSLDPMRRVLITSGPSDAEAARHIAAAARRELGPLARALPDLGEFDLAELRALIVRAAVYIGGDSGPLHIAATTQTPIVELLGPTLAERSRPWRSARYVDEVLDAGQLPCRPCAQRQCVPGDFRCLTGITPGRVVAAVERAMSMETKTVLFR